jgi:segregation and condensation protein A
VNPIRITVADAVAELVDELPRVGPHRFRRLTADLGRAHRGDRAVPRRARAVQAGCVELDQVERFGDIEITWTGGDHLDADELAIDVYEG